MSTFSPFDSFYTFLTVFSIWVFKWWPKVLCMPMFMSMSLANLALLYASLKSTIAVFFARISVSIIISFVAWSLSSTPGHLFCYSSISSANFHMSGATSMCSLIPAFVLSDEAFYRDNFVFKLPHSSFMSINIHI